MIASQTNHVLSPDTQVTLLLCAGFGQKRTIEPRPLTLKEYNSLARWLYDENLTPKDLLDPKIQNQLSQTTLNKLDPYRILALLKRGATLSLAVERWASQGLWILARGDAEYPKFLKERLKHQAPAIVYGVGDKKLLSKGGLAIVGSRDIDDAGLEYTQRVAGICAEQNIQVISGGARGIDQASILSALEAGGTAVGVIADSLAKAALSKKYRTEIQKDKLTLISTYDPNASFNVGNAMGRNKYIYAMSDYALVVNSTVNKGGTWAGATEALSKMVDVPVLVRVEENIAQGNLKLMEKGAIAFPDPPWNLPLTVSIADRVSNSRNKQKSQTSIVQNSLLDYIDLSTSHSQKVELEFDARQKNQQSISDSKSTNNVDNSQMHAQDNPQNIYEAVLPLILQKLETPKNDKSLAELLEVQLGQMRAWLKKAVSEGKIKKNQRPVTYEINRDRKLLLSGK